MLKLIKEGVCRSHSSSTWKIRLGSRRVAPGVGSSRRVSTGVGSRRVAVGCSLAVCRIGIRSYLRSKQTGKACHRPPPSPAVGVHDPRLDFVLDGAAHPASGAGSQRTGHGIAVDASGLNERVGRHVVHQGRVPLGVVVVAVLVHVVVPEIDSQARSVVMYPTWVGQRSLFIEHENAAAVGVQAKLVPERKKFKNLFHQTPSWNFWKWRKLWKCTTPKRKDSKKQREKQVS